MVWFKGKFIRRLKLSFNHLLTLQLYPARIIKFFNDNVSCQVLFHDGYKKKVKQNTIEKLPADYTGVLQPPKPQPKESFSLVDPTNHNQFVCDICNKGFRKEK